MPQRASTRQHRCERCGKPTSRLFGVGAGVQLADPDRSQVRVAALGYCLEHRENVVPDWRRSLELDGTVEWMPDEPVDLRPRDADAFVAETERTLAKEFGGFTSVESTEQVPQECPHCGGRLGWGGGPHAGDARVLKGKAFAWECLDCKAGGLLMSLG
jgi:hypothetical protein